MRPDEGETGPAAQNPLYLEKAGACILGGGCVEHEKPP